MPRRNLISWAIAVTCSFAANCTILAKAEPELSLLSPTDDFSLSNISTTDASFSNIAVDGKAALLVATKHKAEWPGITLRAPHGHWDLSPYAQIVVSVKNPGSNSVTVSCRVDNPGADGKDNCANGELTLAPRKTGNLYVELKRASNDQLGGKLFGMRGYPSALGGPGTINPSNVTQLLLFVAKPTEDHQFEVSKLRASGQYAPPTAWTSDATPFFPFIDTFGQYRHKDWPGKTESLADMQAKRDAEAAELAAMPGPKEWDKFGGWGSGPLLQTSGFFRTEKVKGKWWLVDPDGHLFFSHGIDCIGFHEQTPIDERESWFQDFPGHLDEFKGFLSRGHALMGHYEGQSPECFSFVEANLLRKYGAEWKAIYPRLAQQRLRSWGVNTIGNWSDRGLSGLCA